MAEGIVVGSWNLEILRICLKVEEQVKRERDFLFRIFKKKIKKIRHLRAN